MGQTWRVRRTTILTGALLAFLIGLGIARLGSLSGGWVVLVILLNLAVSRRRRLLPLGLILLGLSLGWWRGSIVMKQLTVYKHFQNQVVVLRGVADNDSIYDDKSQLTFDLNNITVVEPVTMKLIGKIKVAGLGIDMIYRGDQVQVKGKLFKTRGSRQASVGFASVTVLARGHSPIDTVRRRFSAGMESALPEPLASFALGLLIGQRTNIPEAVNKRLSTVGLTHLVAVSGYNLTILVEAVRRLAGKRSKYQSTALSLLLIFAFLLMTGLSASIVRAAIVSLLSIGAWYYGRKFRPLLILSLAAVLTAGWNPLYLWSDLGWHLSFLAFFGVLVFAPLLAKRLFGAKQARPLSWLLLESVSAQLMAAPLIMYIFGQVSLVGILANVLVVPLVPLAMLVSLFAGLAGMLLPALAGWLAWPARLLLIYMLDVASALSRLPHALALRSLFLWQMISLYGLIVLCCLTVWHKTARNVKITDENQLTINEV